MAGLINPCHVGDIIVKTLNNEFRLCRVTEDDDGIGWKTLLTVSDYELAMRLAVRHAALFRARAWVETPDKSYLQLQVGTP